MDEQNLYDTLGISKNATAEEIKQAFRNKAKKDHTDRGGDNDKMVALNNAYAVLKNPDRRKHYDATGEQTETPFDKKFAAFVQAIFVKIVFDQKYVEEVDIVKEFKTHVKLVMEQQKGQKNDLEEKIDKLKKVIKRLKTKKNTENQIADILDQNASMLAQELTRVEGDIKFIKDCQEVLSHYDYKFDKPSDKDLRERAFGNTTSFYVRM